MLDDPRISDLLAKTVQEPAAVIVGFPSEKGVEINGGRVGASKAPRQIRKQLYKLTPPAKSFEKFTKLLKNCLDLGDIELGPSLEENQEKLGRLLAPYLLANIPCIVIGGGHETSYGHFLAYAKAEKSCEIVNLDAHADVRELKEAKAHSGSPFRQALSHEKALVKSYSVVGLQAHSMALSHLKWLEANRGSAYFVDEVNPELIQKLYQTKASLFASFDIDVVDQSQAPGVSAPACGGLSAQIFLKAAYLAGRAELISSFDICECNPQYDRDQQTTRLAALAIWNFLCGLSEKNKSK